MVGPNHNKGINLQASFIDVFWPIGGVFYVVAKLTNGFVADLTAVVAELTAVVVELDVADSTCRRVGCRLVADLTCIRYL